MAKEKTSETPLMKQYYEIKGKYPDALLLFRVGDFYETFGEDAIKAAGILGIVLTKRANGSASHIELAGFPYHSLDSYLPKLVRAGQRVAICEQLEDPKLTKSIVKRGVTEMITPGVAYNERLLDHKSNNFLASVCFDFKRSAVAFADVSTGEFLVAEGSNDYIEKLLSSFRPTEVLYERNKKKVVLEVFGEQYYYYPLEDWVYQQEFALENLTRHFNTISLKGFGVDDMPMAQTAAGAILHYLASTQNDKLGHLTRIGRIEQDQFVWLDRFTIRNLEIFSSPHSDATTLIDVLDNTISPMGGRMLKRWLALPLKNISAIKQRQEIVAQMLADADLKEKLRSHIAEAGDVERIVSKVAVGKVSPRELQQLRRALVAVEEIRHLLQAQDNLELKKIAEKLNPCSIIRQRVEQELQGDAPVAVNKGNVIAQGVSADLDELRAIAFNGKDHLVSIQQREIARTGITSLKIAFNSVFGYYLEVTNSHKEKVPSDWIRKQTLVNAERYVTEELKRYEEKIIGAEEKILQLESQLFNALVQAVSEYILPLQLNGELLATLDCLHSFADTARSYNYCRPDINDSLVLEIKAGRHPVIERQLPASDPYVPNDIYLDDTRQQIIMITGPNMAGKSALLRQTALIVLLAQTGSYVPAESASIGVVDKIFTRVGASDNISSGESTFMVEMNETASILNNVSPRSLILLDEIGRGTSTYDGISIAWAIAEYLHEHKGIKPKTLFATHYHELNEMSSVYPRIRNYNVSVREIAGRIIFLRKLIEGGSQHSFGIHVAKLAGMPETVVRRAGEVLKNLEKSHSQHELAQREPQNEMQLSFFQLDDPLIEQLKEEISRTDINTLTPVEALLKLSEIKKFLKAE